MYRRGRDLLVAELGLEPGLGFRACTWPSSPATSAGQGRGADERYVAGLVWVSRKSCRHSRPSAEASHAPVIVPPSGESRPL
ncbi:hypothetical protein [Phytohabitans houttuyneae]|uniref:hypothetical protein n=1 Tax=Phytohabitans houttuyneae TaxID=1076126 RepID=UPI0035315334